YITDNSSKTIIGFYWGGEHSLDNSYKKSTQVKVTTDGFVKVYIARRDVPRKVDITNLTYWDIQYIGLLTSEIGQDPETKTIIDAILKHIGGVDNPHKVNKSQVGLGRVDNTNDEEKPLSKAAREKFQSLVSQETFNTI